VTEEWRDIPGVPDYQASTEGRIRRTTTGRLTSAGRVLRGGYAVVSIKRGDRFTTVSAHGLVALAFIGPRANGLCVNHIDGDKHNSRPSNLEYVTPAENNRHAFRTGLNDVSGESNPSAVLTRDEVERIREAYLSGATLSAVAIQFGISKTHVCAIVGGKSWGLSDIRRTRRRVAGLTHE
jgi:hypothetical protein